MVMDGADDRQRDGWLDLLHGTDYRWDDMPGPATEDEIAALIQFAGRPLPADYLAFLRRYDGAGLRYRDLWYVQLWRAADIPAWSAAYGITPSAIPGALVIGSDGGSEALVLDMRPERPDGQYPVCAINWLSVDWVESMLVAPDFRSLLVLRRELLSGHRG